jgi:hypothetical protein
MILKMIMASSTLLAAAMAFGVDQPAVRVEPATFQGSAHLQEQTENAIIRDYLESWQAMSAALEQNRPEMLDRDFVGTAQEKLAGTIRQQGGLGLRARYRDRSHDLQVLFYSPEGLSVELIDTVEYDVQLFINDKAAPIQPVRARYIVVLTPAELRWKVRVLQAQPE